MTNIATGIKDLLVADGVGLFNPVSPAVTDWVIFIGKQQDSPIRTLTIYDSAGQSPNPKWLLDFPGAQVRIKGGPNDYLACDAKGKEVVDALLGLTSQDINGDRWVSVSQASNLALMGWDENKRPEFSINFALIVEPAIPASTHRLPL